MDELNVFFDEMKASLDRHSLIPDYSSGPFFKRLNMNVLLQFFAMLEKEKGVNGLVLVSDIKSELSFSPNKIDIIESKFASLEEGRDKYLNEFQFARLLQNDVPGSEQIHDVAKEIYETERDAEDVGEGED